MMLRAAFGFFTRFPVGSRPLPPTLEGIAAWLPVVGLTVGAAVGVFTYLASLVLQPLLAGCLGCGMWVALTGGLHLDGVSDCGDGLMVETSRERRLEIMKDSRLGTFGGAALFFNLIFKLCALSTLAGFHSPVYLLTACCVAGVLSRSMIFIAMRYKSARPGGLGDAIREGTRKKHAVFAMACVLTVCFLAGGHGWIALLTALLTAFVLLNLARKRLGGVTGDVFGCLIETTEWAVLFSFCLSL